MVIGNRVELCCDDEFDGWIDFPQILEFYCWKLYIYVEITVYLNAVCFPLVQMDKKEMCCNATELF
jgi:hypothetical protein